MKNLKNITIRMIAGLALTVIFSSCIDEDSMEDCPRAVFLKLEYTLNSANQDRFGEQVRDLDLFIYDQSGQLVENIEVTTSSLEQGNKLRLNITPGEYTAVVWGNNDNNLYDLSSVETLSDMRLRLRTSNSEVSSTCNLFHGMCGFKVSEKRNSEKLVCMTKNSNNIHVILEDITPGRRSTRMAPDTHFSVRISGSNGVKR